LKRFIMSFILPEAYALWSLGYRFEYEVACKMDLYPPRHQGVMEYYYKCFVIIVWL
jgi:hypothetical protein